MLDPDQDIHALAGILRDSLDIEVETDACDRRDHERRDAIPTGAAVERVGAFASAQKVVADAADHHVATAAAEQQVVPGPAIQDIVEIIADQTVVVSGAGKDFDAHQRVELGALLVARKAVADRVEAGEYALGPGGEAGRVVAGTAVQYVVPGAAVEHVIARDLLEQGDIGVQRRTRWIAVDRIVGADDGVAIERIVARTAVQNVVAARPVQTVGIAIASQRVGERRARQILDIADRHIAQASDLACTLQRKRYRHAVGEREAERVERQSVEAGAAIEHMIARRNLEQIVAAKPEQLIVAPGPVEVRRH